MGHNPRGLGLSAFVDIFSIWAFLDNSAQTLSEWLSTMEKSAKLGLGPLDTEYVHSMTLVYPVRFAGKVSAILSTDHIKMLKSYEEWRGISAGMLIGDGVRDQLLKEICQAVANHRQYCIDTIADSAVRAFAIQTRVDTRDFFSAMVNYIEGKLMTLGNISIPHKSILLLLSNQVVRMCEDIHAVRTLPIAASRYAWVTLRALECMKGFVTANFRDHPGINSAYLCFLTCSSAGKSGGDAGLKESVDSLSKEVTKVKKLLAETATKESLVKVDNKLENYIRANKPRT